MSSSNEDIDASVREHIDAHRAEINAEIRIALRQLNGTDSAALTLMTGFSAEEIDDLGGLPT